MGDDIIVSRVGDGLRVLIDYEGGAMAALDLANTGARLEIIDGPVCSRLTAYGQDTWYWRIYFPAKNIYGWVAEGPTSERWICPITDPNCDR